jgi:hypothetical protein
LTAPKLNAVFSLGSVKRRHHALLFVHELFMLARLLPALACSLITLLSCLAISASAHADDDHERAHRARLAGQIKPLSQVLRELSSQHPGQVLEVELERDHGTWMYEVKVLAPDGRVRKLKVNASTDQPTTPIRD